MIRGRTRSEMIRLQARKSELQAESRSCGPEVRVLAGQPPRIRTDGLGASTEEKPQQSLLEST